MNATLSLIALSAFIQADGAVRVEGAFEAPVPVETAWAVLADYEHLDRFVSSMQDSRVLSRNAEGLLLEQKAEAGILLWEKKVEVTLRVREAPMTTIAFRDEKGKDFTLYSGTWTVVASSAGARVRYQLTAAPRFKMPGFIARRAFTKASRGLLEEVREEMLRRARKP